MHEPTKPNEYKCAACHRPFWSILSRRALESEYRRNYPGELKDEPGVMCHECWHSFRLGATLS